MGASVRLTPKDGIVVTFLTFGIGWLVEAEIKEEIDVVSVRREYGPIKQIFQSLGLDPLRMRDRQRMAIRRNPTSGNNEMIIFQSC